MGNGYMKLLRLCSHPAFSMRDGELHCPLCDFKTSRVPEYDKHFFTHNPTEEQVANHCSGRTLDKWRAKQTKKG